MVRHRRDPLYWTGFVLIVVICWLWIGWLDTLIGVGLAVLWEILGEGEIP